MKVEALDYGNIPGCTYATPEIASVGLTEKQAKEQGYEIKVGKFPFQASGKAVASNTAEGFVKLLVGDQFGEHRVVDTLGDTVKNGRRGSLGGLLTVKGVQGHVAYPHLARNPVHEVAPALAELAAAEWDRGNDFFPATSFQISNINAGTGASNVIPGDCQVLFNFRFSTEVTDFELRQRTETILQSHGLDYEIEWKLSGQPFLTDRGALVDATVAAIKEHTGADTHLSTAGGTSDGRFIAPTGAQVVELGPVNATIHKVDEHTSISELDTLTGIYQSILKNLLAG